jgi:hypothetical protein
MSLFDDTGLFDDSPNQGSPGGGDVSQAQLQSAINLHNLGSAVHPDFIRKAVTGRTYTQGVDFDDFQTLINENVNDRVMPNWFNIVLNQDVNSDIYIANVQLSANMPGGGTAINITSAGRIANTLYLRNIGMDMGITSTAPVATANINAVDCYRIGLRGKTNYTAGTFAGCIVILGSGAADDNVTVSGAYYNGLGARLEIEANGQISLPVFRNRGIMKIMPNVTKFTCALQGGVTHDGMIIDERSDNPLETFVRKGT